MNNNDIETNGISSKDKSVIAQPNARRPGPPTKYTPKTVARLVGAVGDGLGLNQACVVASISYGTLMKWQREKPDLAQKLEYAKEKSALKHLNIIKAAAERGDWRASEAFLKLTRPEIYRKAPAEPSQNYTQINTAITLTPEQQERIWQQRKRILASMPDTEYYREELRKAETALRQLRAAEVVESQPAPAEQTVQKAEIVDEKPRQPPPVTAGPESEPEQPQRQSAEEQRQSALLRQRWQNYQRADDEPERPNDGVPRLL